MSALGWALAGVLAVLTVTYVLWPWLAARRTPVAQTGALQAAYTDVLSVIRALDDDLALGKLAPDEHATARADQVARGIALLKAIDDAMPAPQDAAAMGALDDQIEAAVSAQRQREASSTAGSLS